jgi:hypothetical protein
LIDVSRETYTAESYGRFGFDASSAQGYDSPHKGADFMALLLDEGLPRAGRLILPAAFDEDIREHAARQRAAIATPRPA